MSDRIGHALAVEQDGELAGGVVGERSGRRDVHDVFVVVEHVVQHQEPIGVEPLGLFGCELPQRLVVAAPCEPAVPRVQLDGRRCVLSDRRTVVIPSGPP